MFVRLEIGDRLGVTGGATVLFLGERG